MSFKKLLILAAAVCFGLAVLPVVSLNVALVPLGLLFWAIAEVVDA